MKDLAVFGLGRFGKSLAITYSNLGGKVVVVDISQEKIDEIADYVTLAIKADVTEENIIPKLGVGNVDIAVIAMGDNFEASIIVTSVCKNLGIKRIIAKAKNAIQGDILQKVGADEIIIPEDEMGERMANNITHGEGFMDIAQISSRFSIVEVNAPKAWVGKNLIEINPRKKYGFNVIAVKRDGKFDINVNANVPLEENTQIVVLGQPNDMKKVFKKNSKE